jgi:type IV pilus assembly protein PilX
LALARHQRGVVLFIALIVLVAMTLAGLALMRSVDTGNVIAGNLAFKQGLIQEADITAEAAATTLFSGNLSGFAVTNNDVPGETYFATAQPTDSRGMPTALTDPNFDTNYPNNAVTDLATNTVRRYVIERMCNAAGAATTHNCSPSFVKTSAAGGVLGSCPQGCFQFAPIFRVTVRLDGPRNTVGYTQVMLRLG